ncbi:hypothetical protein [Candidatus Magnetaquicoccus inordinatus]|uniref:hypothetical protein n=1 Tax=Candidatus Magnetaquicoccus inordinatus TaxID=2496818 RepID=UPI00102C84A6|nr:hypothetical protein [Candidatus Magnetaquicoccus inordinatus]
MSLHKPDLPEWDSRTTEQVSRSITKIWNEMIEQQEKEKAYRLLVDEKNKIIEEWNKQDMQSFELR